MKRISTKMWAALKEFTVNGEAPRDQHELIAFTTAKPKETRGRRAAVLNGCSLTLRGGPLDNNCNRRHLKRKVTLKSWPAGGVGRRLTPQPASIHLRSANELNQKLEGKRSREMGSPHARRVISYKEGVKNLGGGKQSNQQSRYLYFLVKWGLGNICTEGPNVGYNPTLLGIPGSHSLLRPHHCFLLAGSGSGFWLILEPGDITFLPMFLGDTRARKQRQANFCPAVQIY